ncbi:MAG: serine/threonine-protein phosphatase [Chloroflexi bacterium]|nr:serine/threonine-protein phosphatase [Chloroflexota bacterium]MYD65613.1 serine/threonine-protein phosphatase [Chloroflexota bacterium]
MLQATTHIGLVRETNEDVALAEELPDGRSLLVVADGVGGLPGGDVASRTAVDALADAVRSAAGQEPEVVLRRAFAAANDAVRAGQQGALERMSTTLVAALVDGGTAWVANIGDSRAYLVAGGEARQLTLDHSWVEESIRAGLMSPDDPLAALSRNLITRAIGLEAEAEVDVFWPIDVPPGSVLLLCTDGLHGVLDDQAIADAVAASAGAYASALVDVVLSAGAPDNVAVALLGESPGSGSGTRPSPDIT